MKIKFNNLYSINQKYINKYIKILKQHILDSQFIGGKSVSKFEDKFKNLINIKYCISCANGTDALIISLKSLNLKKGDEVLVPTKSWISTSEAVTAVGAKIIFCDTEKNTNNICINQIKSKITKKTKAIIVVHLFGLPANMKEIIKIAKLKNLYVIEDCAQAHLAKINNKYVGTFGDIASFSFFPTKNLGSLGDAGCMVTNNRKLAEKARLYANHGGKGKHLIEGVNSRLDSLQAAFLIEKIKYLNKDTNKRINLSKIYHKYLKDIKEIKLPEIKKGYKHVYHLFVVQANLRDNLRSYLTSKDIQTSIHYPKLLFEFPAYNYMKLKPKNYPISNKEKNNAITLPFYPEMKYTDVKYVCSKIKEFYKAYSEK